MRVQKVTGYKIGLGNAEARVLEEYFIARKREDFTSEEAWSYLAKRYERDEDIAMMKARKHIISTEIEHGIDFYNLYQQNKLSNLSKDGRAFLE